jgi:hypothetical protein
MNSEEAVVFNLESVSHHTGEESGSHRRMVSAVLERDRRIATMGAELGLLRGRLKEATKRCEAAERLVTTHQQEDMQLRAEIDALKAKAHGLSAVLDRTTIDLERKDKDLAGEREKRKSAEVDADDLRTQLKNADKVSKVQISRFQEGPKKSFHEVDMLHKQLADQENVITVLRQENFRLLQILKAHGISNATSTEPPEYTRLITQQRMKDVPSLKKFRCTPTRDRTPSPNAVQGTRGVSPVGKASPASTIPAMAQSRSRSKSPMANGNNNGRPAVFKVGHRVMWKNYHGIVRYVGELHCADGQHVGVELSTKNGDHAGAIDGVQYFSCPPKTGIFCRMWDLMDAKGPTKEELTLTLTDAVPLSQGAPNPPATVSQLRDFQRMYENL